MVERGGERYLTRAGNLSFDGDGYLVDRGVVWCRGPWPPIK
jgi:flagellar basal body rod protein FlgG